MNTLIEIYDERAIENVIGPETFKPKRVIYLCDQSVIMDKAAQKALRSFFRSRGLMMELIFVECSMYKTGKIFKLLEKLTQEYKNCAVDVTGGTDAVLFAAGMFCVGNNIPAFTYSRKNNQFYDINNAEFADGLICTLEYKVEDFFKMTGGVLRQGRVDNHILFRYMDTFEPFFQIFLRYRRKWADEITYIQRISQVKEGEIPTLQARGAFEQKGERGSKVEANPALLQELQDIGYIKNLKITDNEFVEFLFRDENTRNWLRDVGSVLELYMYKVCVDTGLFNDVISSAVVDWDGTVGHDSIRNEIDVVAARGTLPIFVSCKATEIKTEAINELAILRDRFGGKGAKAVIVTSENCNAAARHRAAQLGIAVIDLEELKENKAGNRLEIIWKGSRKMENILEVKEKSEEMAETAVKEINPEEMPKAEKMENSNLPEQEKIRLKVDEILSE